MRENSSARGKSKAARLRAAVAQAEHDFLARSAAAAEDIDMRLKKARAEIVSPEGQAQIDEAERMFKDESEGAAKRFYEAFELMRQAAVRAENLEH